MDYKNLQTKTYIKQLEDELEKKTEIIDNLYSNLIDADNVIRELKEQIRMIDKLLHL